MKEGDYGFPITSNFPLVDAVVFPNILLQFTTSQTHKGASKKLKEILDQLKKLSKELEPVMVFVVPQKIISDFVLDSSLDIKQVLTCDDRPTDAEVLNGLRPTKKHKTVGSLFHMFILCSKNCISILFPEMFRDKFELVIMMNSVDF